MLLFSDQALLHQKQCGALTFIGFFLRLVHSRLSLYKKNKRRRKLEKI